MITLVRDPDGHTALPGFWLDNYVEWPFPGDSLRMFCVAADPLYLFGRNDSPRQVLYWPGVPTSVNRIFDLKEGQSPEEIKISSKPAQADGFPGSRYDTKYYDNVYLRGAKVFLEAMELQTLAVPSYRNERSTSHFSWKGLVTPKLTLNQVTDANLNFHGFWTLNKRIVSLMDRVSIVSDAPDFAYHTAHFDVNWSLLDLVNHLRGYSVDYANRYIFNWWQGGIFQVQARNFTCVTQSDLTLNLEFDMVIYYNPGLHPERSVTCHVTHNLPTRLPPGTKNFEIQEFHDSYGEVPIRSVYAVSDCYGFPDVEDGSAFSFEHEAFKAHVHCLGVQDSTREVLGEGPIRDNLRFGVTHLTSYLRDNWWDVTRSSAFSIARGSEDLFSILGEDNLQNLSQLPGLAESFPKIAEALKLLGKVLDRDFSTATLKEVADYITSTILKVNFDWIPNIQLLRDWLPKAVELLKLITTSKKVVTARGAFHSANLPAWATGREDTPCGLTTRTKIVANLGGESLLDALFTLDSFGLLPKGSALWNLVPFSFVANWFTGVGAAMQRVEALAKIAFVPAYFVHSYAIDSRLSETELEGLNLSTVETSPASYFVYRRDVTCQPTLDSDNALGFGVPQGLPWTTFLSLLYQLILGGK